MTEAMQTIQRMSKTLSLLTFDEKIQLVSDLGLYAAYCPECLCSLGSPYCHPLPEINGDRVQEEGCPSPCLYTNEK